MEDENKVLILDPEEFESDFEYQEALARWLMEHKAEKRRQEENKS